MNVGELVDFLVVQPMLALTIGAILMAVGAGMLSSTRPRLSEALRNIAYLGLGAALVVTVAQSASRNTHSEAALWLDRTRPAEIAGKETVIAMRADGHFWVEAALNGTPVEFLIDTGATYTGVSRSTAQRVGLRPDAGDSAVILETANGPAVARMATAESLRFGGIAAHALPVAIGPDGDTETNVIGMNLLSQLSAWRVEGDRLIMVPASAESQR